MGVDLEVMASHFRERRGEMLATATLRFDRDDLFFSRLTLTSVPCLVRPLPDSLKVSRREEDGLKYTDVDRRGERLTFTTSTDLRQLLPDDDLMPWNQAILAFLRALPPETRIVLYWC